MNKFYLSLIFIILSINTYSQIYFTYTFDEVECARKDYTFTPFELNSPDSVIWIWNDGEKDTIREAPFVGIHKFKMKGMYSVKLEEYKAGTLVYEFTDVVTVYDIPNFTIDYLSSGIICARQDTIAISVTSIFTDPTLNFYVAWGDDSTTTGLTIGDLNTEIKHKYLKTSCDNEVTLGTEVYYDQFLIIVNANNRCIDQYKPFTYLVKIKDIPSGTLSFQDSVAKFDPETGFYQKCDVGETVLINTAAADTNKCLNVTDVNWYIYDTNDNLVFECLNNICEESITYNFQNYTQYRIVLEQGNECGESNTQNIINIRELPYVKYTTIEKIHCYPAKLNFINNSADDIEYSIWDFIGDSSNVIVDTSFILREHQFTEEGEYEVTLWGYDGFCYNDYDSTLKFLDLCQDMYVPNAFIPESSNEKINNFKPKAQNLVNYRIDIYNMHGESLWSSQDIFNGLPAQGWNGTYNNKECPQGTYFWKIYAEFDEGEFGIRIWEGLENKRGKKKTSGTFTLIR